MIKERRWGLDYELVKEIMDTAGCDFTQQSMPFKRVQAGLKHGTADIASGASVTKERGQYAWFTAPYRREIIAMFMLASEVDTFTPQSFDDIGKSKLRFGVGIGAWYGVAFDNLKKTNPNFSSRLMQHDDFNNIYNWLERGRVQVVINDLYFGLDVLRRSGKLASVKPHPYYINDDEVYLMLSKKSLVASDVEIITKAIEAVIRTKKYRAILAKYTSTD
ncbi:MAG: transporter substrate-binding domain-containing protein [Kordiimonadaceae bacterium]|nr:transporter substrate-binding domain-containing protein [Kordiimonadaceae bacterium]